MSSSSGRVGKRELELVGLLLGRFARTLDLPAVPVRLRGENREALHLRLVLQRGVGASDVKPDRASADAALDDEDPLLVPALVHEDAGLPLDPSLHGAAVRLELRLDEPDLCGVDFIAEQTKGRLFVPTFCLT